jgi:WD40 repeat protein
VLFSPDGTHLVTVGPRSQQRLPPGSFDRTFGRWRIREIDPEPAAVITAAAPRQTLRHDQNVGSVAFSPAGTCLLTSDNAVRVWRRLDASPVARTLWKASADATFKAGHDAVWSPDGTLVAYSRSLTVIVVADPAAGHEIHHWHTGYRGVSGLAFSPDSSRLAGVLGDKSIVMWDPGWDGSVVLWDMPTGDEIAELTEHTGETHAVAFSPDGTRLATASSDGMVILRHPLTGSPTHRMTGNTGGIWCIAFSPDSAQLAVAGSDATVRLWNLPADGD